MILLVSSALASSMPEPWPEKVARATGVVEGVVEGVEPLHTQIEGVVFGLENSRWTVRVERWVSGTGAEQIDILGEQSGGFRLADGERFVALVERIPDQEAFRILDPGRGMVRRLQVAGRGAVAQTGGSYTVAGWSCERGSEKVPLPPELEGTQWKPPEAEFGLRPDLQGNSWHPAFLARGIPWTEVVAQVERCFP